MPSLDYDIFTPSGERGWIASWHAHLNDESMVAKEEVYEEMLLDETRIFISVDKPNGITERWTVKLRGQLKPREKDGLFEFGLTVAGRAKVRVVWGVSERIKGKSKPVYTFSSCLLMESSLLTTGHGKSAVKISSAARL